MQDNKDQHENEAVHVYDGIVEQNNPMPTWWIWLFFLSIIFGFHYWLHYTVADGTTLKQEYDAALKQLQEKIDKSDSTATAENEESLTAYMKSETAVTNGAAVFAAKCAMCHGEHLEGKIGPNLTDRFWVTGDGSRMAILHTVTKGSTAKGMPAWEGMLKPKEIKDVTAYVFFKIGTNPENPKAPEGAEVK